MLMTHGEKAKAARRVAHILEYIHGFTRAAPMPILRQAVLDASPAVRVMTYKAPNGKVTHIPVALSERQRAHRGIRWIVDASDTRMGMHRDERIAREVVAVLQGDSEALRKKRGVHELAMANRGTTTRR